MKVQLLLPTLILFFISFQSIAQQTEIVLDTFASGFNEVTDIANAGDERLFIVEQPGIIKILNPNGTTNTIPFLNISAIVENSGNEQGLLGLCFHPNYKNNGYFYVNYTSLPDGDTHISRFTVSSVDSNIADPNSEVVLLSRMQPFPNHNAGDLSFGPDGYLYFGLGDGGAGGDQLEQGQDSTTLLGKMLRIDVDGGNPYAIPPTNPFVGDTAALDEIWALGLRNPWRFSFDPMTGDMWIADVGQNQYEEINIESGGSQGGMNWGWDCYEGNHIFEPQDCGPMSDYDFPIFEYAHAGTHCSVTGGFVYRGTVYPDLIGHYVFADLCSGQFWTIYENTSGGYDTTNQGQLSNGFITTFGLDMNNEMYAAERNNYIFKVTTNFSTAVEHPQLKYQPRLNASPNPFSGRTNISFEIPKRTEVQLNVYDHNGRLVSQIVNGEFPAGKYQEYWSANEQNGNHLSNGIYYLVLTTEQGRSHNKLVLIK